KKARSMAPKPLCGPESQGAGTAGDKVDGIGPQADLTTRSCPRGVGLKPGNKPLAIAQGQLVFALAVNQFSKDRLGRGGLRRLWAEIHQPTPKRGVLQAEHLA